MALLDVEQLIFDLYRCGRGAEYLESPKTVIDQYDLTETERGLLLERNVNGLYDLGVHPMIVMYFARLNGMSVPEYLETLRQSSGVK